MTSNVHQNPGDSDVDMEHEAEKEHIADERNDDEDISSESGGEELDELDDDGDLASTSASHPEVAPSRKHQRQRGPTKNAKRIQRQQTRPVKAQEHVSLGTRYLREVIDSTLEDSVCSPPGASTITSCFFRLAKKNHLSHC